MMCLEGKVKAVVCCKHGSVESNRHINEACGKTFLWQNQRPSQSVCPVKLNRKDCIWLSSISQICQQSEKRIHQMMTFSRVTFKKLSCWSKPFLFLKSFKLCRTSSQNISREYVNFSTGKTGDSPSQEPSLLWIL